MMLIDENWSNLADSDSSTHGTNPNPAMSTSESMMADTLKQKESLVRAACEQEDLGTLAGLATSANGFISDELRRLAWPILLGSNKELDSESSQWSSLPPHRDEGQVKLDVNRSFVYYPDESDSKIDKRKIELDDLIVETLRTYPELSYFQGYHDIVQVMLLVLGRSGAITSVARLSLLRIRDFMLPSITAAVSQLDLLRPILHVADSKLEEHLSITQPFFALPATLTLYAHDIQEYSDIARLFDFLLAWEASMSLYLFAIIICSRKQELLEIEPNEPEMLHSILCKLPKPLDLEKLIADAVSLFQSHPPDKLPTLTWLKISPYSVLKTTRVREQLARQTVADGQMYFRKHAAHVALMQRVFNARTALWRMRRPTGAIGVAVLVAVLSWWLRRDIPLLQRIWDYSRGILRRF